MIFRSMTVGLTRDSRSRFASPRFFAPGCGGDGTVLVNTSGSMSLNVEQVEQIVRSAGDAAVVAIRRDGELVPSECSSVRPHEVPPLMLRRISLLFRFPFFDFPG